MEDKGSEHKTMSSDDVPVSELPTKTSFPYIPNLTVGIPKVPTKTPPRYKQCYRVEWESMPDFKEWLKSVPGEPTRAFCTYCDKSLHAHRLSLLKHTCTVKHTKAAQSAYAMKASSVLPPTLPSPKKEQPPETNSSAGVEYLHQEDEILEETGEEEEEEEVGDAGVEYDEEGARPAKLCRVDAAAVIPIKTKLSTHVLDTAKGNPVGGLQVSLYKLIDSRWRIISEGYTNPDGRYSDFIEKDAPLIPGRYKMHFDVDRYFELRKLESLYPFIEIVFDVKSPQDHYHIPLLLSPFGYTTYRGS